MVDSKITQKSAVYLESVICLEETRNELISFSKEVWERVSKYFDEVKGFEIYKSKCSDYVAPYSYSVSKRTSSIGFEILICYPLTSLSNGEFGIIYGANKTQSKNIQRMDGSLRVKIDTEFKGEFAWNLYLSNQQKINFEIDAIPLKIGDSSKSIAKKIIEKASEKLNNIGRIYNWIN